MDMNASDFDSEKGGTIPRFVAAKDQPMPKILMSTCI